MLKPPGRQGCDSFIIILLLYHRTSLAFDNPGHYLPRLRCCCRGPGSATSRAQTADVIKRHLLKSEPLKACRRRRRRCPRRLKRRPSSGRCGRVEGANGLGIFLQMSSCRREAERLATANQIRLGSTMKEKHGGDGEYSIFFTSI